MPPPYSKAHLEIRTLEHLSYRLGVSQTDLVETASFIDEYYRKRKRPKKDGTFRVLSVPTPKLKKIQKKIHRLLREVAVNEVAHCGIKKRSNLSNAGPHCGKRMLLNLDFEKFFNNISHHQVYHLFSHNLKCSPKVSRLLTRLSTFDGEVPQGGPMSTDISNLVCRTLDLRLLGLSKRYGLTYTRYCDDLSFSGQNIPDPFIKKAKAIIIQCGFKLKRTKENRKKIVTGLSVNGTSPRVPSEQRKEWAREIYIFEKHEAHRLPNDFYHKKLRKIEGKKSYLNYIEKGSKSIQT